MTRKFPTLTLPGKLALAVVSASSYWLLSLLMKHSDTFDELLSQANAGFHLVGIIFGALVMAPYVAASARRTVRVVLMCVASAVIYYLAVRFVVDGPLGHVTITSYILSGSGAALLAGLAVVALAPKPFSWKLIPLTLAAGAAGGAAFELELAFDANLMVGHAAWQLLVCLALHYGLLPPRFLPGPGREG